MRRAQRTDMITVGDGTAIGDSKVGSRTRVNRGIVAHNATLLLQLITCGVGDRTPGEGKVVGVIGLVEGGDED